MIGNEQGQGDRDSDFRLITRHTHQLFWPGVFRYAELAASFVVETCRECYALENRFPTMQSSRTAKPTLTRALDASNTLKPEYDTDRLVCTAHPEFGGRQMRPLLSEPPQTKPPPTLTRILRTARRHMLVYGKRLELQYLPPDLSSFVSNPGSRITRGRRQFHATKPLRFHRYF